MPNRQDGHFVEGTRIYLREVRLSDVTERYYRWMNDPEITEYLEVRYHPNSIESIQAYVDSLRNDRNSLFLAIVLKDGDRHIGNIKLGPINWIHRFADVSLVLGEKDCWGKGYGAEAIGLITRYGLEELNLHKLTAGCYAGNEGSLKAFLKSGWEQEGVKRRQFFVHGQYTDGLQLAIFRRGEA
jgi:[ribosomal protein S5]-alanine N-acetyltransferase